MVLVAWQRRSAALHLLVGVVGAVLLSEGFKQAVERPRPTVVPRLVEVSGFSYPSGHSIAASATYLTVALLARRRMPLAPRRVVYTATAAIAALVAVSRVYLGVHYPSDVTAGVLVGAAWALLVAWGASVLGARRAARG